MGITWLTAFLDLPVGVFEEGRDFWLEVTGYSLSVPRGPGGDFATLVPTDGDPYLRVQRIYAGPAGCHLDLHDPDWAARASRAAELGAREMFREPGLAVFGSPGGLAFCVTAERNQARVPPHPRVDVISVDAPTSRYDAECRFWSGLTGWPLRDGTLSDYRYLESPDGLPLQIMLQRIGEPDGRVRAHLDLSVDDVAAEVARHAALGATVIRDADRWTTLRDPAGLVYCLTPLR